MRSEPPVIEFDRSDGPEAEDPPPPVPASKPKGAWKKAAPPVDLLTEDWAAQIFADRHAGDLLYCHDSARWYTWTGAAWIPNRSGLAFQWARELARELCSQQDQATRFIASKVSFASGVERFCRVDPVFAVTADAWDRDPWLLGTPGGTVDLRTGELRRARPDEHITKLTAVAPVGAPDCPLWLTFLQEATGSDATLIRFLRQWAGYCLTGLTREHALVFVHGAGGNGKSVFLNVLIGILGAYATTAAMDTFTATRGDKHPTDMAMLRGARLVTASETEADRAWAEARIKQLTGGDPVTARFMRQDFFTFLPTFKLTIVGNHRPMLRNVDEAARRRFNIVPFTRKPERPDRELEEKLQAEWPAILRWMIEGCADWQLNGLVRPDVVRDATEEYFAAQDSFGQWLEDHCLVEAENPFRKATTQELFASWGEFARSHNEPIGTLTSFGDRMDKLGFRKNKNVPNATGGRSRGYEGIELRNLSRRINEAGEAS